MSTSLLAKDRLYIKCISADQSHKEYFKYRSQYSGTDDWHLQWGPRLYIYNASVPLITALPEGFLGYFEYDKKNNTINGRRLIYPEANSSIDLKDYEEFTINLKFGTYKSNHLRENLANVGNINLHSCEEISKRKFKKNLSFYFD